MSVLASSLPQLDRQASPHQVSGSLRFGSRKLVEFDKALIIQSLEIAGERAGDIAPLVYARLFSQHPEMLPLFVRDKTGAVRGEMLFKVIEAILDFIGPRVYANMMIRNEVVTHEGYGVPREVFGVFFATLRNTLREILGRDWSPQTDASWRALLSELDEYVAKQD